MSDADVKEARRILRLIQEHLLNAHLTLGATQENVGLVDVIYSEDTILRDLNYVTPRKNTAWVPGPQVEKGLERLHALGREKRVYFIEGLYLPIFAKSLRELGLNAEREISLMTFTAGIAPSKPADMPEGVIVKPVETADERDQWRNLWRDPAYDMMAYGVEPMYVGDDADDLQRDQRVDLILLCDDAVAGGARLTFHGQTAHIMGVALRTELHTPETARAIHATAIQTAVERGSDLVFISGEREADRAVCREIGFVDTDSIICYAESAKNGSDGTYSYPNGDALAQPVLALR